MWKWVVSIYIMLASAIPLQAGIWNEVKRVCGVQTAHKEPLVKVLIGKELDGAMIEVKGRYNVYDPYRGSRLSTCFFGKSKYMQPVIEGLKWGEVFPGTYQLAIVPDRASTTTIVNGIEYKGSILVYQVENTLYVINEIPIEDYVHSVLSAYFEGGQPALEVMSTMAIAVRTDAYYQVVKNPQAFCHVDATQVGYTGYAITKLNSPGLEEILASTRYLVLSRTRSYEGEIEPIFTACLEKGYNEGQDISGWNLAQVETLASKGENAAKILQTMYPEGTVEMLNLKKSIPSSMSTRRDIASN